MTATGANVNQQSASYIIGKDDVTYYAIKCSTGVIEFSGAVYATVLASAVAALPSGTGIIADKYTNSVFYYTVSVLTMTQTLNSITLAGNMTAGASKTESKDPNTITHEIIMAPGQAVDGFQIQKSDGTIVFNVDKDGQRPLDPDSASFIIWKAGTLYYAKNGATGIVTSAADASTLIQACIDAMTGKSGEITFKNGTYTITTTITVTEKDVHLRGESRETVLRLGTGANQSILHIHGSGPYNALSDGIIVENLMFDGNQAEQGSDSNLIDITYAAVHFKNWEVYNHRGNAVYLHAYAQNGLFEDFYIHTITGRGFYMERAGDGGIYWCKIRDGKIWTCTAEAIASSNEIANVNELRLEALDIRGMTGIAINLYGSGPIYMYDVTFHEATAGDRICLTGCYLIDITGLYVEEGPNTINLVNCQDGEISRVSAGATSAAVIMNGCERITVRKSYNSYGRDGFDLTNCKHCIIEDCSDANALDTRQIYYESVNVHSGCEDTIVRNNDFRGSILVGVQDVGVRTVIENNVIGHKTGMGVYAFPTSVDYGRRVIGNTVFDCCQDNINTIPLYVRNMNAALVERNRVYQNGITKTSLLASNANSGQKVVVVVDATQFFPGQAITIADSTPYTESNVIYNIALTTNTLTMVTNLSNTYTTAQTAHATGIAKHTFSIYAYDCPSLNLEGNSTDSTPLISIAGTTTLRSYTSPLVNSGVSSGTGAQQTIAHGLPGTPNRVILWDIGSGANPYQSSAADGTDIYVTAAVGVAWGWEAKIV